MKKFVLLGIISPALFVAGHAFGADAVTNYGQYCAACHGKDGAGMTRAGRMVKAKDFTDPAYQKTFTDDQAVKDVTEGLVNADGVTKMRPFGGKLAPDDIKALVAYVRSLSK